MSSFRRLWLLVPALIALAISVPTALAQTPVVTQPSAQTANNASSTIAVSNTFQSVFAASAKRFGCSIQNNGSNSMWVYFGPIANATKATSFVVTAGSALLCGSLGVVAKDQVSITGTAADAFTATQDGSPSLNGGGSGGGGGGGAVTIADGADVTQGAIADAVVAAGAAGTVNAHLRTISGQLPATIGQKTMAASLPVVIASDQSAVPISAASLPLPTLAATSTKQSDGSQKTQIVDGSGNVIAATSNALNVAETAAIPAGSNLIGKISIDQTTPGTTNGVTEVPVATSGNGLTSVVSSAVESNHVIKGSAGNLYGFQVTTGAASGFVFVSNTTTAPTAGGAAIAPIKCYAVAANSTLGVAYTPVPLALSTGITLVFSTTGCFTNTASTTAFFSGDAK